MDTKNILHHQILGLFKWQNVLLFSSLISKSDIHISDPYVTIGEIIESYLG
jgi:hypothetical protein